MILSAQAKLRSRAPRWDDDRRVRIVAQRSETPCPENTGTGRSARLRAQAKMAAEEADLSPPDCDRGAAAATDRSRRDTRTVCLDSLVMERVLQRAAQADRDDRAAPRPDRAGRHAGDAGVPDRPEPRQGVPRRPRTGIHRDAV